MTNYYPLTAAQKMHHNWIMDYGTQQVSGVSVVASVQAELDFGLLKKCIQMETERSGCTRIRFTKPDKDGNVQIEDNVMSIMYAEEQAGYLAGYAAVTEGYKNLGFMGGIAVPAVIRYGYGFIQGADAAAKDMGLKAGDIKMKYTYVGNFDASPENNAKAAAWYNEGTECIFACGGGVGNSVMKAAETADKVMIGVDVDQSVESETVITSAMKNLGDSIYGALEDYYNDSFQGGKTVTLDASQDGVKLPMETSKFKVFTQEKYDELYAQLKDGTIKVGNDQTAEDATGVPTEVVKVELIK